MAAIVIHIQVMLPTCVFVPMQALACLRFMGYHKAPVSATQESSQLLGASLVPRE